MNVPKNNIEILPVTVLFVCATCVGNVYAQESSESIEKITANWECKWCPGQDDSVSEGEVNAGVAGVSNDSFKFGDYTGLYEKGAYAIADLEYYYQGKNGEYGDVEAYNLGLESRQLEAQGGWQGLLDLELNYDQIPKLVSDTTRTPYNGDAYQTLPSNWVYGNTQAMSELANSLRNVDLLTHRKTFEIGATYHQNKSLSYDLSFRRDTKEGKTSNGLAIGFNSAILATPVEYTTDQGQLKINYAKNRWNTSIGYIFSKFDNSTDAIRWENAFQASSEGQADTAPSNTMQQLNLSGSYRFGKATVTSALLSLGRMEQNEAFLPITINTALSQPLPKSSLDGKIDTYAANLKVNSRLNEQWQVEAGYAHDEQDNKTARATYDYVNSDNSDGDPRTNTPYSFKTQKVNLEGRYRPLEQHNIALGYDYETINRTFQEVEKTNENSLWGTYKTNLVSNTLNLFARIERSSRTGDDYQTFEETGSVENPLMRKYNLADRDRNKAGLWLTYSPVQRMEIGFFTDYADDDYSNSELGLKAAEQANFTVDFQYGVTKAISFYVDYTVTSIKSNQAGSSSFSTANWYADNEEVINVANAGYLHQIIQDKLKLGIDYTFADSTGDITVSTGEPFPSVESTRHTFKIYGDYNLSERSIIHVGYLYEKYDEKDWAVDDVAPNTISNVLTMGEVSPSYEIGMIVASLKYAF